jgi:hypothetical protein
MIVMMMDVLPLLLLLYAVYDTPTRPFIRRD